MSNTALYIIILMKMFVQLIILARTLRSLFSRSGSLIYKASLSAWSLPLPASRERCLIYLPRGPPSPPCYPHKFLNAKMGGLGLPSIIHAALKSCMRILTRCFHGAWPACATARDLLDRGFADDAREPVGADHTAIEQVRQLFVAPIISALAGTKSSAAVGIPPAVHFHAHAGPKIQEFFTLLQGPVSRGPQKLILPIPLELGQNSHPLDLTSFSASSDQRGRIVILNGFRARSPSTLRGLSYPRPRRARTRHFWRVTGQWSISGELGFPTLISPSILWLRSQCSVL